MWFKGKGIEEGHPQMILEVQKDQNKSKIKAYRCSK